MVEHSIKDHLYASLRCYLLFRFYFMVLVHDFIAMLKVDYLSNIACVSDDGGCREVINTT